MAAQIIDRLKLVQIAEKDRQGIFLAVGPGDLFFNSLVEISPIVEVREGISHRQVGQGLLGLFALRDISDDRQPADDFTRFIS